jgi:hypothetical protein
MRSDAASEPLDLVRIVTTAEDVRALRRARERRPTTTEQLQRAVASLPQPSSEAMRRRKGPTGPEPFRL